MNKKISMVFLALLCMPLIFAAPPVTTVQQYPEGYLLNEAYSRALAVGEDKQYNLGVFNASTGYPINNESVKCYFYLADNTGISLLSEEMNYVELGYWSILINGSYFNSTGDYAYNSRCYDGGFGGSLTGLFYVNPTGYFLEDADATLYAVIIVIIFIIIFILVYLCFSSVSNYVKYVCLSFGYILSHVFFLILWKTFDAFLYVIPYISTLFRILYEILTYGYFIFFPALLFFLVMNHLKDKKITQMRERGFSDNDIKMSSRRNRR